MSARCAYCDSELRPNSMFCLSCGQLVGSYPPVPQGFQQQAPQPASAPVQAERPVADAAGPVPLPAPFGAAARDGQAETSGVPAPPTPPLSPLTPQAPPAPARVAPDPPAAAAPVSAPPRMGAVSLAFSTGDRAVVSGVAVIGRVPQAAAQNSGAQAVEVRDTSRSVSRVHLHLTVRDGVATVTDAGSGNGSGVERRGVRTPLVEGRGVAIQPGDRIWLGDVSAEVAAG